MPPITINTTSPATQADPGLPHDPHQASDKTLGSAASVPRHADPSAARQSAQPGTRAQDVKGAPNESIRGRVFALKDGSGYVIQSSNGRYYQLDSSGGNGLVSSSSAGYVDIAQVNVVGGPISRVDTYADPSTPELPHTTAELPDLPPIINAEHAQDASRMAHIMIRQSPQAALRSQANLDSASVLSLLR